MAAIMELPKINLNCNLPLAKELNCERQALLYCHAMKNKIKAQKDVMMVVMVMKVIVAVIVVVVVEIMAVVLPSPKETQHLL